MKVLQIFEEPKQIGSSKELAVGIDRCSGDHKVGPRNLDFGPRFHDFGPKVHEIGSTSFVTTSE